MTDVHLEEPRLIFFRATPADLLTRPPLASSLQHLETSFLLLAMGRYPHALVTCGSAIESAIKAAIKASPHDHLDFKDLIDRAILQYPGFATVRDKEIREFRLKRNEIIHFGFSPKDDEISAESLLKTGYPLIEQCYEAFFQFSLSGKGDEYGGLLPDVAHHFNVARRVYAKAQKKINTGFSYCLRSFIHKIRQIARYSMLSDWESHLLISADAGGEGTWTIFEFQEKQREELDSKVFKGMSWNFDCPICGAPDSFVSGLDGSQLYERNVSLNGGVCVSCSFVIPIDCPYLAEELCGDQVDRARSKILKEFGYV